MYCVYHSFFSNNNKNNENRNNNTYYHYYSFRNYYIINMNSYPQLWSFADLVGHAQSWPFADVAIRRSGAIRLSHDLEG